MMSDSFAARVIDKVPASFPAAKSVSAKDTKTAALTGTPLSTMS